MPSQPPTSSADEPHVPPQRVVLQGWCSLLVPRAWSFAEEQGVTTIQPPTGDAAAGSINISLFTVTDTPAREELTRQALRFAEHIAAPIDAAAVRFVTVGGSPASYFEARDDADDFWRVWHIGGAGRLVLLTWHATQTDASDDRELIDRVVRSFAWEDAPVPTTAPTAAPVTAPAAEVIAAARRSPTTRRRKRNWPRLRRWILPLLLFALLYGRYLLGWAPAGGDLINQYIPYQQLVREAVRAGELPFWNTMTFAGRPLMADIQVGVWYPPNWLHWLLPLPLSATFALVLALHGAWMILGCWFLARHWQLARPAAALATVLFCAGPFFTLRLTQGVVLFIYVGAWWPWIALAVSRLLRRPGIVRLALLSITLALALLAGAPQIAYYGWLMGALLGAALAILGPGSRRADLDPAALTHRGAGPAVRRLLWLGFAFVGALGLAAGQMLPTIEYIRHSFERGGAGAAWEYITDGSLAPRLLLLLLNPGLLGDPRRQDELYWGKPPDYAEGCFYHTLWVPLVLVPLGLYLFLRSGRRFREGSIPGAVDLGLSFRAFRLHKLLGALALLAIVLGPLLALGQHSGLFALAYQYVPGFDRFRVPARLMLFYNTGLALWAGLTLHRLLREPSPRRLRNAGYLTLALAALALIATGMLYGGREAVWGALGNPFGAKPELASIRAALDRYATLQFTLGAGGVVLAAGALWFVARGRRRLLAGEPFSIGKLRAAGWVVATVAAAELLTLAWPMRVDTPIGQFTATHYADTPLVQALRQNTSGGRILWLDDVIGWQFDQNQPEIYPNRLIMHGLADARGYDPVNARWFGRFMNVLADLDPAMNPRGFMFVPQIARPAWLTPLGVELVLSYQDLRSIPSLLPIGDIPFPEGPLHLYRNADYQGPAFLAPLPRVAETPEQQFAAAAGRAAEPGTAWADALIADPLVIAGAQEPAPAGKTPAAGSSLMEVGRGNHARSYDVQTAEPRMLVFSESAWPGWSVRVNGELRPLSMVQGTWMGIGLAAGAHQVELDYQPPGWVLGRLLSVITMIGLAYGCARVYVKNKRNAARWTVG